DPTAEDCGVGAWIARSQRVNEWVVLMEDRQPEFFHEYRGHEPGAIVPLNRHGPNAHVWTQADLRRLVRAFHVHGVRVLLGYWIHECAFASERHREVLIRDAHGNLWEDPVEKNADFNPMKRLVGDDPEHDVRDGERYS